MFFRKVESQDLPATDSIGFEEIIQGIAHSRSDSRKGSSLFHCLLSACADAQISFGWRPPGGKRSVDDGKDSVRCRRQHNGFMSHARKGIERISKSGSSRQEPILVAAYSFLTSYANGSHKHWHCSDPWSKIKDAV